MTNDGLHCVAALIGVSLITAGAWIMAGSGPGMLVLGSILLVGVVYARTRVAAEAIPTEEGD